MKTNWDLTVFYKDFSDPAFVSDLACVKEKIEAIEKQIREAGDDHAAVLEELIARIEEAAALLERLSMMTQLTLSCDAENEPANNAMTPIMRASMAMDQMISTLSRYLASIGNLEQVIESCEMLRKNSFFLRSCAEAALHRLPEALEGPMLQMQLSGGEAFSQLRDKLDAGHLIELRGEMLPLSAVRAKAYDADASVRKDAYEAEIDAYKKIELPMSVCLNSIKAEACTMAKLKGYGDVLEMTLSQSHMKKETLEAMWTAIREVLPDLRLYFKAKAKLLGHQNGLPFYDLFAPVGACARTYTIEEARELLLKVFGGFCPEMGSMMKEAFDEGWIDVYPRAGKRGGAFCAGYYEKNISRVLINFAGSLSDVSTLAHELGHAFNNRMMHRMPRLLNDPPMPLAETASTFNETLLSGVLRAEASREEEMMLLDASLTENTQTIVDIYSRFLFEQKVVEAQADHALSVRELKDAMLQAQEATYGDGLDPDVRHPYMWACKPHYYSTGMHFYNFPYAFGSLFGRGLYARYEQEGPEFAGAYCDLLARFGSDTIENVAAGAGIDVTDTAFWRGAVRSVAEEAQRFAQLIEQTE